MFQQTPFPMPTCPMAETCKDMIGKRFSGIALGVAGLVFIALGVLIVIEPGFLAWSIAAGVVFLGVIILLMACLMRKIGKQLRRLT